MTLLLAGKHEHFFCKGDASPVFSLVFCEPFVLHPETLQLPTYHSARIPL